MKVVLLIVAMLAVSSMGESSVFKSLASVLEQAKSQEASLLTWILPSAGSSSPAEKRSFCFVASESFLPLAGELSARGHSVSFAGSFFALPTGVRGMSVNPKRTSAFGEAFDKSLALYETIKAMDLDVVVFPAHLAYMSIEAKKAGTRELFLFCFFPLCSFSLFSPPSALEERASDGCCPKRQLMPCSDQRGAP